jgi:RNA polymerase primary sigma factor
MRVPGGGGRGSRSLEGATRRVSLRRRTIRERDKIRPDSPPDEAPEADLSERRGGGLPREVTDKLGPEVRALVEEGKKRGFVTYDELNKVLPDDLVSPEKLDTMLQMMDDLGIEMVENAQEAGAEKEAAAPAEPEDEEREFEEPQEPIDTKRARVGEKIDDPVRMYLTQMGEIPLLSREDELRLAKRIEITRKRFRTKVLESPHAVVESIQIWRTSRPGSSRSTARSRPTARSTSRNSACWTGCPR